MASPVNLKIDIPGDRAIATPNGPYSAAALDNPRLHVTPTREGAEIRCSIHTNSWRRTSPATLDSHLAMRTRVVLLSEHANSRGVNPLARN